MRFRHFKIYLRVYMSNAIDQISCAHKRVAHTCTHITHNTTTAITSLLHAAQFLPATFYNFAPLIVYYLCKRLLWSMRFQEWWKYWNSIRFGAKQHFAPILESNNTIAAWLNLHLTDNSNLVHLLCEIKYSTNRNIKLSRNRVN